MSRKRTQCHGGIHSPQMACYHAAYDYPGSVAVIAVMMGKSEEVLRKKLSTATTHVLTLAEAMHILRITNDTRILDAICAEAGAAWFNPDTTPAEPSDIDVLASGTSLMDRAVSVLKELNTALEDGEIDPEERARLDQRIMSLHQSIGLVSETAKHFEIDAPAGKE